MIKNFFRSTIGSLFHRTGKQSHLWNSLGETQNNRYQTESPNPVETHDPNDPVLMGIMAEILSEELSQEGILVPFWKFPQKNPRFRRKRRAFWKI
jgi:hypothetical protein